MPVVVSVIIVMLLVVSLLDCLLYFFLDIVGFGSVSSQLIISGQFFGNSRITHFLHS